MFKKKKAKSLTPAEAAEAFRRQLNDAIDEAQRHHVGQPTLLKILENKIAAMRYASTVNARSSCDTASTIEVIRAPRW
jgi:hypothetical protein